jgi:hypothetical protein
VTDLCLARFPPVVQHERPPPARVDIEGLINFVRNAPISHRTAFQKWGGSRNTGATARHDLKLPSECSGHLLKLSCSISRRVAARSQDRQRAPSVRWRAGRGTNAPAKLAGHHEAAQTGSGSGALSYFFCGRGGAWCADAARPPRCQILPCCPDFFARRSSAPSLIGT